MQKPNKEQQASHLEKLKKVVDDNVNLSEHFHGGAHASLRREMKKDKDFAETVYNFTSQVLDEIEKIEEPENKRSHAQRRQGWLSLNADARNAYENTRQR